MPKMIPVMASIPAPRTRRSASMAQVLGEAAHGIHRTTTTSQKLAIRKLKEKSLAVVSRSLTHSTALSESIHRLCHVVVGSVSYDPLPCRISSSIGTSCLGEPQNATSSLPKLAPTTPLPLESGNFLSLFWSSSPPLKCNRPPNLETSHSILPLQHSGPEHLHSPTVPEHVRAVAILKDWARETGITIKHNESLTSKNHIIPLSLGHAMFQIADHDL